MAERLILIQMLLEIFFSDTRKRIGHARRKYFQKRRRIAYMMLQNMQNIMMNAVPERRLWAKIPSTEWWDRIVLDSFNDPDFKKNFRVEK